MFTWRGRVGRLAKEVKVSRNGVVATLSNQQGSTVCTTVHPITTQMNQRKPFAFNNARNYSTEIPEDKDFGLPKTDKQPLKGPQELEEELADAVQIDTTSATQEENTTEKEATTKEPKKKTTKRSRKKEDLLQRNLAGLHYSSEDPDALEHLKVYLEFCFSDVYLYDRPKHLTFKPYEYTNIEDIMEFPILKQIGASREDIMQAFTLSENLELNEAGTAARKVNPILEITDDTANLIDWYSYFKGITRVSDMNLALNQFFQLEHLPPLQLLNIAIVRCGELDSIELAEKIFKGLEVRGASPLATHLISLSVAHMYAMQMDTALDILDKVISKGYKPDVKVWTEFINQVCKSGKLEYALILFEEMKKCGTQPDAVTYSVLIKSCGVDDEHHLKLLLDEMKAAGVADTITYNYSLMQIKSKNAEEAQQLIQSMKDNNVPISPKTYQIYLHTIARSGDIDLALQALAEYDEAGHARTIELYSSLLYCCYVGRHIHDIQRISLDMLKDGFTWTKSNFHCLLGTARKSDPAFAFKVFEMMKKAQKADTLAYNLAILSYAKTRNFDSANELYQELLDHETLSPDAVTLSGMIYAQGMTNGIDSALTLLEHYRTNNAYSLDAYSLNMLLNVCKEATDLDKTFNFFKEQLANDSESGQLVKGARADKVSYGTLISACSKFNDMKRMFEIYEEMKAMGHTPDHVVFSILLNACNKVGDNENMNYVTAQIIEHGYDISAIRFYDKKKGTKKKGVAVDDPFSEVDFSEAAISEEAANVIVDNDMTASVENELGNIEIKDSLSENKETQSATVKSI